MSADPVRQRLDRLRGKALVPEALGEEAVELAAELLRAARRRFGPLERWRARKLSRMMDDPRGKVMTLGMADQVFRSHAAGREAKAMRRLIDDHGVPEYLPWWERAAMATGAAVSYVAPGLVMPLVSAMMRAQSRQVIVPSENEALRRYLTRRRKSGMGINLNQLGEAVLGEEQAARRLDAVIGRLRDPAVDYVSVKLSAIFSQINLVAYEASLAEIKDRLRAIYRTAAKERYIDPGGRARPKFVNLDMEEYRDLHLTAEAFRSVLDEKEFETLEAGLVLQAYLPDSGAVQEELTEWARGRKKKGGAGIKVRLVKGANLSMERVEASVHGWEQAPYAEKRDVDANYKRMVGFGALPENADAVRLGIGSHNLFDIAYAMACGAMRGTLDRFEFEMLEGMANHQAEAVEQVAGEAADGLLLYAPAVRHDDFHSALAYLVRRLDENTSEENFLRHLLPMKVGSASWDSEKAKFLEACARSGAAPAGPRRKQDRSTEKAVADPAGQPFENAPDTDWSLAANRAWIARHLAMWKVKRPEPVKAQIGGEAVGRGEPVEVGDPSRPGQVAYRHYLAGAEDVDEALRVAGRAFQTWRLKPFHERGLILREAAAVFARERGDTIGCMVLDAGKAAAEADVEVSEAIDFANYYARAYGATGLSDAEPDGRGVVVVAPPWNFPYAIPASGVLAALMAGNSVVLKPAPQTVLTAARLARQLWDAGVPKEVLQFLPCPDNEVGKALITDRRVDTVVLTGGYETAKLFQSWRPRIRLLAETSGKNAMVITAAADVEQAAKDLARSAFGHAGQKCSAASLALVEAEVYDRLDFRRQLRDATASLKVGPAWDPAAVVTPLIGPPGEALARAQTELEEGEEWLLEPRCIDGNPQLWSPGIKLGVRPGSAFFRTECFGPVLGLVRVADLDEAIRLQNSGEFGLTGGIQSLDWREVARWREQVEVGNAYANRPITGAIVRRQPFGGWGHSAFGPGAKAGGANYVLAFTRWSQAGPPRLRSNPGEVANAYLAELRKHLVDDGEREWLLAAAWNYGWAIAEVFGVEADPSALHGERNVSRYRPRRRVLVRLDPAAAGWREVALAVSASAASGVPLDLSLARDAGGVALELARAVPGVAVSIEGGSQFAERLRSLAGEARPDLVRAPGGVPREVYQIANGFHIPVVDDALLANGRLELRFWYREQAVSETTHRYGNILPRYREGA